MTALAKQILLLVLTSTSTLLFGLSIRTFLMLDILALSPDYLAELWIDIVVLLVSIGLFMTTHSLAVTLISSSNMLFLTFFGEGVLLTITLLPSLAGLPAGPLLVFSLLAFRFGVTRNLPLLRVFSVRLALTGPQATLGFGITLVVAIASGMAMMERLQTTPFTIPAALVEKSLGQGSSFLAERLDPSYRPIIGEVLKNPAVQEETLANLNRMIEPYLPFAPVIIGILVFFTLSSLMGFVDMAVLGLLHGLFRILPKIGFVGTVHTNEPTVRYTLDSPS
ncbi:MAG: hypothetical protein Q8R11_02125, partial [bacterium]|nr:hypothetical protein [bacterium]